MDGDKFRTLPFGRKFRVGNFTVLKYRKALRKDALRSLRDEAGIPRDVARDLSRAGVPFIKVEAISGTWCVEFSFLMTMFMAIDSMLPHALDGDEAAMGNLANLIGMMMFDTTVLGDERYYKEKAEFMDAAMERLGKDAEVDEGALEDVRRDVEARAAIVEMGKTIRDMGDE